MKIMRFIGRILKTVPAILITVLMLIVVLASGGYLPDGPYNPRTEFQLGDPLRGFNRPKLEYAKHNAPACRELMARLSGVRLLDDFSAGGDSDCGIENRVKISTINGVDYRGLETRCDSALRLIGWVEYGVKPRAQVFNRELVRVDNQGSYSCRNMRTSNGEAARPSLHSFAKAVDITGFRFRDGTRLRLINDWEPNAQSAWKSDFLHQTRDDACQWFNGVLSPDYNALHADHFHFDQSRWRFCR